MQRRLWLGVAAVAAVAALLIFVAFGRRQQDPSYLRLVDANVAKAAELKSAVDQRFVVGALESSVVPVLEEEYPGYVRWPATDWVEYGLPVATEPSDVWYCGSWTRGVKLRFESGRLVSTVVGRWSFDCL